MREDKRRPETQLPMLRRMIYAHARRVSAADPEHLAGLLELSELLSTATEAAVITLKSNGFSWAEIARPLKLTRQAAQQRWGKLAEGFEKCLTRTVPVPKCDKAAQAEEREAVK